MSLFDDDEDAGESPKGNQGPIVKSDAYPMRVLAGAGTGKTFTMVRKIERLLESEQADPGDVLALTFTNKAADSMRSKLNARIGAEGYDIDAYTYHSICHSILKEYPYHADLPSQFTIADTADKFQLAETAIEEIPYQFVNPDGGYNKTPGQELLGFISSMKQEDVPPEALSTYLADPATLIELTELADRLETTARDHLRRRSLSEDGIDDFIQDLDAVRHMLFEEQAALGSTPLERDVAGYLEALADTLDHTERTLTEDPAAITSGSKQAAVKLPAVLFSAYGTAGETMTRKSDFPSGIPKLPYTLVDRLRSYLADCKEAADYMHGYAAYEELRRAENFVDFDDLITATVELLEDDAIATEIAGQWDYVFCDEFQDTDAIQFELVEALAEHNQLFIVGDDDQAIYEWRGADIENIGQKLSDVYKPALEDEELDLNFRSKQPILDLANNAIEALDGRGSDKELTAYGEAADSTDGVAYIDTTVPDESDFEDAEALQASQITTTVSGLLRGDLDPVESSYDVGDIAVLVRKKKHAKPLIEAFGEAGVPFELVGDLETESVGVETVLAYLQALATPTDDVSVRRVLLMRYRLSEADLRTLAQEDASLLEALRTVDPEALTEPDNVQAAREDFSHLLARRHKLSVEEFYHELIQTTNIEWFLTQQERRELQQLEDLIASYDEPASQPPITESFIEYLEQHDAVAAATDSAPTDQDDAAEGAVTIMTVHKSKGLDFPVVILPSLTADQWKPRARDYSGLVGAVADDRFWTTDHLKRDHQEAHRLLHVGITRAQDQLILCGHSEGDDEASDGVTLESAQTWLPPAINWEFTAGEFPIWEQIQSSLPPTAEDWTSIATTDDAPRADVVATYDGQELGYEDAVDTVLGRADSLLSRSLPAADSSTIGIEPDVFTPIPSQSIQRRHSYTSLGTVDDCARKHYLDHVVYAYELPQEHRPTDRVPHSEDAGTGPSDPAASQEATSREIGVLFHETAEAAINQDRQSIDDWLAVCEAIAAQQGLEQALPGAKACVERFFQTEVAEWELLSAEHSFEIKVNGSQIIGEIDCVARRPSGEVVVLDYKATGSQKGEENLQLPLYILACEELFDDPITTAGYVYVSDIGPAVDLRSYDEPRLTAAKERIEDGLKAAQESTYDTYTAGSHCQWCPHNELSCSQHAPEKSE